MRLRSPFDYVEMGVYLLFFRGAAWTMPIKRLVRVAAALAERLPPAVAAPPRERSPAIARRAARRVSRLVPGATCLHRALASRVWLARRGVSTELVVGFRKEGAIEGHAWLQLDEATGETLFAEEGYRRSFAEADLVGEISGADADSVDAEERKGIE